MAAMMTPAGCSISRLILTSIFLMPEDHVSHDECVHPRSLEAVHRFFGGPDDRLVFVERSIQDYGDSGQFLKFFDDAPIKRIGVARDGLHAAGAVDMRGSGDLMALLGFHQIS